jgi:hypothetical protein
LGNTAYDKKFLWIDLQSVTIHMSEHQTKETRHKEASLVDVTAVVAGPPEGGADVPTPSHLCLSINFKQRRASLDLMFDSQAERDEWHGVLAKLFAYRNIITKVTALST